MSKVLIILGLLFQVSDLVGDNKALAFERKLLAGAKRHLSVLETLLRYTGAVGRMPLVLGLTIASGIPYILTYWLAFQNPGWSWIVMILVVLTGITSAIVSLAILEYLLPGCSQALRGMPERRLVVWARLAIRHNLHKSQEMENKHTGRKHFPYMLGIIVAIVMMPLAVGAMISRVLALVLYSVAWIFYGAPTLALEWIARRLGNPSYFRLARFVINAALVVSGLILENSNSN